jgi:hypothetical protein
MSLMPIHEDAPDRLRQLESRRALAAHDGDCEQVRDLADEIRELHAAYVGAAVTAIASLRAALGDRAAG